MTNQIQFSLIDTRPLHGMSEVCKRHGIKLLTYGTLVRISPFPHSLLSAPWFALPLLPLLLVLFLPAFRPSHRIPLFSLIRSSPFPLSVLSAPSLPLLH